MGSALMGGMGVGSGMGLMKYLGDVQASKNDRALNATMAKWAPFVKGAATAQMETPRKANLFGSLLGGAGAGGDFMQKNPQALSQFQQLMQMSQGGGGMGGGEDLYGAGQMDLPQAQGASINPWVAMAGNVA